MNIIAPNYIKWHPVQRANSQCTPTLNFYAETHSNEKFERQSRVTGNEITFKGGPTSGNRRKPTEVRYPTWAVKHEPLISDRDQRLLGYVLTAADEREVFVEKGIDMSTLPEPPQHRPGWAVRFTEIRVRSRKPEYVFVDEDWNKLWVGLEHENIAALDRPPSRYHDITPEPNRTDPNGIWMYSVIKPPSRGKTKINKLS